MNIVKQEKITEEGLDYIVTEYDNGTITKELYSEPSTEPLPEPEPTQLDRIEEVVISTALTTEYMACLQEVNAE